MFLDTILRMRAFVTGATGFIGSHLVSRLVAKGWRVRVLVRKSSSGRSLIKKNIEVVVGDLTDQQAVQTGISNADVIFNVAAALPYHRASVQTYWATNVEGVKNILEACKGKTIKRIIHISTVGIYGSTTKKGADERTKPNPTDVYAQTKLHAEKLITEYSAQFKLPTTIIRPTIGYGPGDTRPVFLSLFKFIRRGLFIPIGRGDNFFHTIYIDNLIDALLLVVQKKEAIGEDFIIGDDPCPTFKTVIREIAHVQEATIPSAYIPRPVALIFGRVFDIVQALGLPAPLTTQRIHFMTQNKKFIIDKAKRLLGYKPRVRLQEGIERTFQWYVKNGYL